MASGPAVFPTSRESTNYARLCRLLVDVGSQALRDTFDRIHPPATLHSILSSAYPTLQSLRKRRILNLTQWGKLYPTIASSVSSASFDITLLMVLLRHICGFKPPASTGSWDKLPLPYDNSPEANIARIKYYRNEIYAHTSQAFYDSKFNMLWQGISKALLALGSGTTYSIAISCLKTECMDPDVEELYQELLKEWKKDDDNTKKELDELEEMLTQWKREEGDTKANLGEIEDAFGPADLIDDIRQLYKNCEGWLAPFPWCEEFRFHLGNIFTRLKMVSRKEEQGTKTDFTVNRAEIFKPHEECSQPRNVLIVGQPGMGKTTLCNKVAYDWAKNCQAEDSFPDVQVLLLLKCRDINSDLWEAIDDQLLPKDIKNEEKEKFFTFVRDHQSKVLLILDGLDEMIAHQLPVYKEIIQGRELPKCQLVVTACHEAGIKVQECCDTLLEVEGFTKDDAGDFIRRYFKTKEHLVEKLLDKLRTDVSLKGLTANPLNTALLCLLCEDLQGNLPEGKTLLYLKIVWCVLKRYRHKKDLPETDNDPTQIYHNELKRLGCIALNGLLNDEMYFEDSAFGNGSSNLIPELGFLSVQPGHSKRRPSCWYGFLHRSFQEFFAAFYLSCQLVDEEISPDDLVADTRFFEEFQQVLMFTCGILAQWCEEKTMALMASVASQINQSTQEEKSGDFLHTVLNCIRECEKETGTFGKELAHFLGSCLEIQHISCRQQMDDSAAVILADAMATNSTVTRLYLFNNALSDSGAAIMAQAMEISSMLTDVNLSYNTIGDSGAVALAQALEINSTLTKLNLSHNEIGDSGAAALAQATEINSTLKKLDLSYNQIGGSGTTALAQAMEINLTLTKLNLSHNHIGGSVATALAQVVEINSTLTKLNLSHKEIGDPGAAELAKATEINSTLRELDLSHNEIGDSGAAMVAKAMQINSTLTKLNVSHNKIGDSGAAALAQATEMNSTLTKLNLSHNKIGDSGAAALAQATKVNSMLTKLNLSHNKISDSGAAALAQATEINSTLTKLNLSHNQIGGLGTTALAQAMEINSTLRKLDLSYNEIGDLGAAALAVALAINSTLTKLDLTGNGISDAGAAALAHALAINSTLTQLALSYNKASDAGAAALAQAMESNLMLTELYLCHNEIGESGVDALAKALKTNSVLTWLDLSENKVGDLGAAVLAEAMEENSTLTKLYLCHNEIGESGVGALAKALEKKL